MEPNTNTPPDQPPQGDTPETPTESHAEQAPVDALSRTPDDLEHEEAETHAADAAKPPEKKAPLIKRIFRKLNVYFLLFLLLIVVAGAIAVVNYLNSQKPQAEPTISDQQLTEKALQQLKNTDATVGDTSQTLTIQGNAIIAGQTLMRGDLNVAGNFQSGGSIQGPSLTISGDSNLGKTQADTLQVAKDVAIQGSTTIRDLNVSGTTSFSGPVKASQLTVTRLILAGNGSLEVPNHLSFSGATPGRSIIGAGMLGSGGSLSINGSDTSGTININTGNGPNGTGCLVRINFRQTFTSLPHVLISPVNSAAGALQYYVERNQDGFSLCTNNTPGANKSFAFDYFITG